MRQDEEEYYESPQRNSRKRIFITITIIVLIVAGAIYWFGYRPSVARKHCTSVATTRSGITMDNWSISPTGDRGARVQSNYMFAYEACMQSKGL